jgi:hypothetical protein
MPGNVFANGSGGIVVNGRTVNGKRVRFESWSNHHP